MYLFTELKEGIEEVKEKFEKMEGKVDNVEQKVDNLQENIGRLKANLSSSNLRKSFKVILAILTECIIASVSR